MRCRSLPTFIFSVFPLTVSWSWAAESPNASKMLITEVAMKASNDWVELYVVDGSVDWSGYRLHKGASTYAFTIPASWIANGLQTGDYIVIHEESGTDDTQKSDNNAGTWDGYGMGGLTATDFIVQIKEPSGSTNRVDGVIWSNANGSFSSGVSEANGMVSDGAWDSYNFSAGDAGAWTDSDVIGGLHSLSRYLNESGSAYEESDSKDDWYASSSPTPGSQSDTSLPVKLSVFQAVPSSRSIKVWWKTESELECLGFYVNRSDEENGRFVRISNLIPGLGNSSAGSRYGFEDRDVESERDYWYMLEEVSTHGESSWFGPVSARIHSDHFDTHTELTGCFPNPFNPFTTVEYFIGEDVESEKVRIDVHDIMGREVTQLVDAFHEPGMYFVDWDGRDDSGNAVSSGIYLCRLVTGIQSVRTIRMVKME